MAAFGFLAVLVARFGFLTCFLLTFLAMSYMIFSVESVTRRASLPERKGAIEQKDFFLSMVKEAW